MKDRYDFMGVRNETGWLSPESRHKVTADLVILNTKITI